MKRVTVVAFLFSSSIAHAAPPDWTRQNGIQQHGAILTIVSSGSGPSLDLARRSAIDQAKSTAAEQLNGSAYVRSMSIETEKTASFHSEVSSTKKVEGLVCKPLSEYVDQKEGVFSIWLKCEFDTKKAKVVAVNEDNDRSDQAGKKSADPDKNVVKSIEVVGRKKSVAEPEASKVLYSENRHLVLSVVPSCVSILIRGKQSRSIPCKSNPVTILVLPTDVEVIIRGPSGFAPKHLKVHEQRTDSDSMETMEVYLDKM